MEFVKDNTASLYSGYLPRERIFSLLDNFEKVPLIGVFAGIGYGKTTLISSYIKERHIDSIWLDMSYADTIKDAHNIIRKHFNKPIPEDISKYKKSMIVFDNYQIVDNNPKIQKLINHMLTKHNDSMSILLISSTYPQHSFSTFKLHNQYLQLNSSELAFTIEESLLFFNTYFHLDLQYGQIKYIMKLTKGWPSAYHLLAKALNDKTQAERQLFLLELDDKLPDISHYLFDEIFESQPPEIQTFLMQTSLLIVLSPDIIDEYLSINSSNDILDKLLQNNLFIELDNYGSFTYSGLMRHYLYERYQSGNPDEVIEQGHIKLSRIYESKHSFVDAYIHAIAGKDYTRISHLTEIIRARYSPAVLITLIIEQLQILSPSLLIASSSLLVNRSFSLSMSLEFIEPLQNKISDAKRKQSLRTCKSRTLGRSYFSTTRSS